MKGSLVQSWIGSYHSLEEPGAEHRAVADLGLGMHASGLLQKRVRIEGRLTLQGLATNVSLSGRVALRVMGAKAVYDLSFRGDDGRPRRMHVEIEADWRRPWTSSTTLVGRVYEGMLETHRVVMRVSLVRSAREQWRSLFGARDALDNVGRPEPQAP